jgi:hypothetical protein
MPNDSLSPLTCGVRLISEQRNGPATAVHIFVAALMKASAREKAETFTTGARFYPRNDTDASQTREIVMSTGFAK